MEPRSADGAPRPPAPEGVSSRPTSRRVPCLRVTSGQGGEDAMPEEEGRREAVPRRDGPHASVHRTPLTSCGGPVTALRRRVVRELGTVGQTEPSTQPPADREGPPVHGPGASRAPSGTSAADLYPQVDAPPTVVRTGTRGGRGRIAAGQGEAGHRRLPHPCPRGEKPARTVRAAHQDIETGLGPKSQAPPSGSEAQPLSHCRRVTGKCHRPTGWSSVAMAQPRCVFSDHVSTWDCQL